MSDWISSYDRGAPTPEVGSRWIWEPDKPQAREECVVVEVEWNGEEWWVKTKGPIGAYWNDLSRFWEACVPLDDKATA